MDSPTDSVAEAPPTILVVEDDPILIGAVEIALRASNYVVLSATEAGTALRLFGKGNIDCVVCDLALPGMSGDVLVRKFLEIDSEAKIVMMSAYSLEDWVGSDLHRCVVAWLQKPFSLNSLLELVQRVASNTPKCGTIRLLPEHSTANGNHQAQAPNSEDRLALRLRESRRGAARHKREQGPDLRVG